MAGISPISSGGYDDYFKKKQLEMQAQASINVQPGGQNSGIQSPQNTQGTNSEGLKTADATAVGKKDPLAGFSTEAAGALIREKQKEQAAATNVPNMADFNGLNQLGVNNMMLVKKRPEEEMPPI